MAKARIWRDYQRWAFFISSSTAEPVWHFAGFGYWAEADTFEKLIEWIRYNVG